jgi:putative oxidoreductase
MSKVKRCFQVPAQLSCASTALLVLRLIAGVAFMYHGWGKIQSPMTWMGPESAVPGFLQFFRCSS